nr:AAA family ATPase [uncultured Chryseobacterium sp.]
MGNIITFYSYKGGVGRSMALSNIAYELTKRNKRVLIIDWDLEAPGIERYFSDFEIENSSEGLLQLLMSYKKHENINYNNYLWKIFTSSKYPISLLHSGRENDPAKYSTSLQDFNWNIFFSEYNGGRHLEVLREELKKDFDFVLIDSRTGLSDSSGICTILMPDILIPMFTANYQSLFGIRDIVKYIENARQKLNVDRMILTVLPIPSRFGTRVEFRESQEWLDRIADILKDCYKDWLPKWIEPKYILEKIKIPQIDYFSFGEKLAVLEQGINDPESMGYIYARISDLLINDFSNIDDFVGKEYYEQKKTEYELEKELNSSKKEGEYLYDVFLSYPREAYHWVRELLIPALTEYLTDTLGRYPKIYFDVEEFSLNESVSPLSYENIISKSRTYVYVITNTTLNSSFQKFELSFILQKEKSFKTNLLFPIIYSNKNESENIVLLPDALRNRLYLDFSNLNYEDTVRSTKLRAQFGQQIDRLAIAITEIINKKQSIKAKNNSKDNKNIRILNEQKLLAEEYEKIRKEVKASNLRTSMMQKIVSKMAETMIDPLTNLEYWTNSELAGERLLAIIKLQKFPNYFYVTWLSEHVGDREKPFIGYQSSIALYIAARTFGKDYMRDINYILNETLQIIYKSEYQDPNQIDVINTALKELQNLK